MLGNNFSRQHFEIVFHFLKKTRFDISCELSPMDGDNLHEISNPIQSFVFFFFFCFQGDNLHEMSNPIFCEKQKQIQNVV